MHLSSNKRFGLWPLLFGLLAAGGFIQAADLSRVSEARSLGRFEFLLDESVLDRWEGVEWVLGVPLRRREPIIAPDQPWESDGIGIFSLFYDQEESRFKIWYRAKGPIAKEDASGSLVAPPPKIDKPATSTHFLCYAESEDGVRWTKPSLRRVSYRGSLENNIVRESSMHDTVFYNILKDPSDPDPKRRYKAFGYDLTTRSNLRGKSEGGAGVCVAYSADGLAWTEPPLLVMDKVDVTDADCILPERDPKTGEWVAFFRPRTSPKRRYIGYATSRDFEHWTHPRMLLAPDASDDEWTEFYGAAVRHIGGWRIGALWVFCSNPAVLTMSNELIYSREGTIYRRAMPKRSLVSFGSAETFESSFIMPYALVEREAEVLIYYRGTSAQHAVTRSPAKEAPPAPKTSPDAPALTGIGLARLAWGHFRGLHAPAPGLVETKWLSNYGDGGINVIADIRTGGSIKVELVNVTGEVIPGWSKEESRHQPGERGTLSLYWDRPDLVAGAGQVSRLGGKVGHVMKLRFYLDQATLYGFRVADPASSPDYQE